MLTNIHNFFEGNCLSVGDKIVQAVCYYHDDRYVVQVLGAHFFLLSIIFCPPATVRYNTAYKSAYAKNTKQEFNTRGPPNKRVPVLLLLAQVVQRARKGSVEHAVPNLLFQWSPAEKPCTICTVLPRQTLFSTRSRCRRFAFGTYSTYYRSTKTCSDTVF